MRHILRLSAAVLALGALAGCSTIDNLTSGWFKDSKTMYAAQSATGVQTVKERRFLGFLSPYRVDIPQGNFISKEMVAQLKEAMQGKEPVTRDQVKFLLGTPLVTDVFHEDRWDYVFQLEKANGDMLLSRFTVVFQDNKLKSLDGGDLPSEKDYIALIAGKESAPPPPQESNGLDSPKRDPKRKGD